MLNAEDLRKRYAENLRIQRTQFDDNFWSKNGTLIGDWECELEEAVQKVERICTLHIPPELVIDSSNYLEHKGFVVGIPHDYEINGNLYVYLG